METYLESLWLIHQFHEIIMILEDLKPIWVRVLCYVFNWAKFKKLELGSFDFVYDWSLILWITYEMNSRLSIEQDLCKDQVCLWVVFWKLSRLWKMKHWSWTWGKDWIVWDEITLEWC